MTFKEKLHIIIKQINGRLDILKEKIKKLTRTLLPILIGLALAGIIIAAYLFVFPGSLTAEKAVTSYIKASLQQDVSDMVRYASEYQKIKLYGSKEYTNTALRNKLEKSYSSAENIYADSEITFSVESITEIDSGSDEYKDFSENYKQITGDDDFSKVAKITVKVYVDGKQYQKQSVYAVKSGLSWYYGY